MLMCREVAELASDYIDDELGPVKRLSIRFHLLICPPCRHFVSNLRHSADLLHRRLPHAADDRYIRRLDEEIAQALTRHRSEKGRGDQDRQGNNSNQDKDSSQGSDGG